MLKICIRSNLSNLFFRSPLAPPEEIISNCSESSNPVLVLEILRATHTYTLALFSHLLRIKTKQKRENSGLEMELWKVKLEGLIM